MSKCDKCASSLMGGVNLWREDAFEAKALTTFEDHLDGWCTHRLSQTWTLRTDLINQTCAAAAKVGENDVDSGTPTLFDRASWEALSMDDRARRDLFQLYGVCLATGECTKKERDDAVRSGDEAARVKQLGDRARDAKKKKDGAAETLRKAGDMEEKCEDDEGKAEEVAQNQRDAADACNRELESAKDRLAAGEVTV